MVAFPHLLLCFLVVSVEYRLISSLTDPQDAAALQSLKNQWKNTPQSWNDSDDDPCGTPWEGVTCTNSKVTKLKLSSAGLAGVLPNDIGQLTDLTYLDLSLNRGLQGSLPPQIGNLQKLEILILGGCSFSGNIPAELGNLTGLTFLSLRINNFTGEIPPSLGNLIKLQWLDMSNNQLTGHIPVSTSTSPGLDLLKRAKQFRFNGNNLSGTIPAQLFGPDMVLSTIMFHQNQFTGEIPPTLGLVQTLQFINLGQNSLVGNVPSNINNLTNLVGLQLPDNNLSGPLPDLTGLNSLHEVELSNNPFQESEAPEWFTTLPSLNFLIIHNGSLRGSVPKNLFSLPNYIAVGLKNNALNGTLDTGHFINRELVVVDLANNSISSVAIDSKFKSQIILAGNPVCSSSPTNVSFSCRPFNASAN